MHAVEQEEDRSQADISLANKNEACKRNKPYKIDIKLICSDTQYIVLSEGIHLGHSYMEKHKLCEILGSPPEYSKCSSKVN